MEHEAKFIPVDPNSDMGAEIAGLCESLRTMTAGYLATHPDPLAAYSRRELYT